MKRDKKVFCSLVLALLAVCVLAAAAVETPIPVSEAALQATPTPTSWGHTHFTDVTLSANVRGLMPQYGGHAACPGDVAGPPG